MPQRAALIALASAVREVIPSQWTRIGLIENEQPSIGFGEHPEFMPLFFETWEFFERDPTALTRIFRPQIAHGGVGGTLPFQNGAYLQSRYYNEFERPLDSCWLLEAIVHDGTSSVASLVLSRPRTAKPFTERDVATISALRPWVLHALRAKPAVLPDDEAAGPSLDGASGGTPIRKATAIFGASGQPLFQTPGTDHLYLILSGAIEPYWRHAPARRPQPPSQVLRVVRALVAAATDAAPAYAPSARVRTPWGLITIEADWLAPAAADPAGLAADIVAAPQTLPIAVTITLHEQAAARAARILRGSSVSPAQVRVGVLLALGKSKPEIAAALGVKESSVADAARKLHRRLGTRNAAELGMRAWLDEGDPKAGTW